MVKRLHAKCIFDIFIVLPMNSNAISTTKPSGVPAVVFSDEDLVNLSVKELNKHLRSLSPEVHFL